MDIIEQFSILIFLISKKNCSPRRRRLRSKAISGLKVRFSRKILIRKRKKIQILSNYIIRDGLSQKTISHYCPFNISRQTAAYENKSKTKKVIQMYCSVAFFCQIQEINTNILAVNMARDVTILMRANPLRMPLAGVGPENRDFFGP